MEEEKIHFTYEQQYRRCNKSACRKCVKTQGHGPYWYAFWRLGTRLHSRYIGKELRTIDEIKPSGLKDLSDEEWQAIKAQYNYTCLKCGKREPEIILVPDHVIPESQGGTHTRENRQPLCKHCNVVKGKKSTDYRLPQAGLWEDAV